MSLCYFQFRSVRYKLAQPIRPLLTPESDVKQGWPSVCHTGLADGFRRLRARNPTISCSPTDPGRPPCPTCRSALHVFHATSHLTLPFRPCSQQPPSTIDHVDHPTPSVHIIGDHLSWYLNQPPQSSAHLIAIRRMQAHMYGRDDAGH